MSKRKKKKTPVKPVESAVSAPPVETPPILEETPQPVEPIQINKPVKFALTFERLDSRDVVEPPAHVTEPVKIAEPIKVVEPPAQVTEPVKVAEHVKVEVPVQVTEAPAQIAQPAKIEDLAETEEPTPVEESAKNTEPVKIVAPDRIEVASFVCPDISVVIPMYNAEKYIAACLDSVLAQTFKNYELIVVDDCSTDSSPKIVKSYIPRFGGRLNHFRLKKNTGGAGIPRNKGITLARGEYVMFIDSDDLITETALEENLKLAREYNSDVMYRTLYYLLSADGTERELAGVPKYKEGDVTVIDNDLDSRVKDMARSRYWLAPWRTFNKREFLLEHELFFPNIRPYEDLVWTHALLIYTKNFLRVPHPIYLYRDNEGSMTRVKKAPADNAKFYLNPVILGLKSLDEYIRGHAFFKGKPHYHYGLLENFFNGRFTSVFREEASELQPHELYETIRDGFGKKLGDYDVLVAALCTALHTQQELTAEKLKNFKKYVVESKEQIAALEAKLAELKA